MVRQHGSCVDHSAFLSIGAQRVLRSWLTSASHGPRQMRLDDRCRGTRMDSYHGRNCRSSAQSCNLVKESTKNGIQWVIFSERSQSFCGLRLEVARGVDQQSYSTSGPVSTGMGALNSPKIVCWPGSPGPAGELTALPRPSS